MTDKENCYYLNEKNKIKEKSNALNDNQEFLLSEIQDLASQLTILNNIMVSKIEKDEEQDKQLKLLQDTTSELINQFNVYKSISQEKFNQLIKILEDNSVYIRGINMDTKYMQNGYKKELAQTYKDEMAPTLISQNEKMESIDKRIDNLIEIIKTQNDTKKIKENTKNNKQLNIKEFLKIIGWIILIVMVIMGIDIPVK